MTDVQVLLMFLFLDSKMAKQQLQKWELKFVTELEPLEGASPVYGAKHSVAERMDRILLLRPLQLRPLHESISFATCLETC